VFAAGQNYFAFLQVGVLEEPVVLVGEAHFVGLVTALIAHFADCCHGEGILYFALQSLSAVIEPLKYRHGNRSPSGRFGT
jgi:hypothetical protein